MEQEDRGHGETTQPVERGDVRQARRTFRTSSHELEKDRGSITLREWVGGREGVASNVLVA